MKDYFKLAIGNIKNRKLRSYLTMLGIIIGVVALVALITLGASLNKGIQEQFDKFGTRRLFVGSKAIAGSFGPPSGTAGLTERDMEFVSRLFFVDYANAILGQDATIEYNNQRKSRQVFGISLERIEDFFTEIDIHPAEGRLLREEDRGSVLIGYRFAKEFFDKELHIGNSLLINNKKFKVVGIIEEQGDQNFPL